MSCTPIHVVILGCGVAARLHSRVLRHEPGVARSYASRDPSRAADCCASFGGAKSFASYEAALADPDIQVALVTTPTSTHFALAMMALEAGRHVIVEKPAFLSVAEARLVQAAAALSGRQLFVAENYVYKPIATELRETITSGQLGEVRFVSLNATKLQPPTGWRGDSSLSGGGALFESGVHWITFAARLGLDVQSVHATRAGPGQASDLSSLVVFQYASGAVGTLVHSWELRAPLGGARLSSIQGTRGAVTFESNGIASVTTGSRRRLRIHLRDTLGYRAMHRDFLQVIRNDCAPFYTFEQALRDLAWVEIAQAGLS